MIAHKNQRLRSIEQSAATALRQLLAFDNLVKDSTGQVISGNYIRVAKFFSYDIIATDDANESLVNFDFSCLKDYLNSFESVIEIPEKPSFFIFPTIRTINSSYKCSLILISAATINDCCVGYAQCLDNSYKLNNELKNLFIHYNIEFIDNLIPAMDFQQSINYIKNQSLLRLNLFTFLSKKELAFIDNIDSEFKNRSKLNLNFQKSKNKSLLLDAPLTVIFNNRLHLVNILEQKLTTTPWYDTNRIIYVFLLRKLHTGIKQYLNKNNYLIYNDTFFKKYEKLGTQITQPFIYYSEYTWLEYQIISGLNEYIVFKEDIINNQRRNALNFHFNTCSQQQYAKTFFEASNKNYETINDIITNIKTYIDINHPPKKILKLLITELTIENSDLGSILYQRLNAIENEIITQWGRFTIKKTNALKQAINDWDLTSNEDDILFIADSIEDWQVYKKASMNIDKLAIIVEDKFSKFLNFLPTTNLSIKDNNTLCCLYNKALTPFPASNTIKSSKSSFVDNREEQPPSSTQQVHPLTVDIAGLVDLPKVVDKLKNLQQTVTKLEDKIKNMEDSIKILKTENQALLIGNTEIKNKLLLTKNQCNETITSAFVIFEKILMDLEQQLNLIITEKLTPAVFEYIIHQAEIISNFSELKKNKTEIETQFNHKELYLYHYHDDKQLQDMKAPIILLDQSRNNMRLYGNMHGKYQVVSLPEKVTTKFHELLDESGCDLHLKADSRDPIEIRCDAIKLYKLFKLLRENCLHDFQIDSKKILMAQAKIKTQCQNIITQRSIMQFKQNLENNTSPLTENSKQESTVFKNN